MATPLIIAGVLTAIGYNINKQTTKNNKNSNSNSNSNKLENINSKINNVEKFQNIYNNVTEHTECNMNNVDPDFTHNNMQHFYGTNVTQNVSDNAYSTKLANFTGNFTDGEYKPKKEVEKLSDNMQSGGFVFGTPNVDLRDRYVNPRNKHNDKPFEQINVGAGIGLDKDTPSSGGYQQLDTQIYAMPKSIDTLRTKNNQRVSYTTPPIPGTGITTNNRGLKAPITKFKRQKLQVDREQYPTSGDYTKQKFKSPIILNNNNRKTTNYEHFNAGGNTSRQQVVKGKYSAISRNILKNVDTQLNLSNVKKNGEKRSGYKKKTITNKEILSINGGNDFRNIIGKSINTLKNILFKPKPTHKEQTITQTHLLNPSGKLKTKQRNNNILKKTNKETTSQNQYYGGNSGHQKKINYNKQKHSVPTTNKQINSNHEYIGHNGSGINNKTTNRTYALNMKQNTNKEVVSKGRPPKGSGAKTYNTSDDINLQINRKNLDTNILGIIPSKHSNIYSINDIHITTHKDSLQNETNTQSSNRINPIINSQLNTNPYNIDITKTYKTLEI